MFCFSEIDETAVKHFNSSHILDVLFKVLDVSNFDLDLSIAACKYIRYGTGTINVSCSVYYQAWKYWKWNNYYK